MKNLLDNGYNAKLTNKKNLKRFNPIDQKKTYKGL